MKDIPRFYTALAEWMSCGIYIALLRKRFPVKKTVLISGVILLAQSLFLVLTDDVPIVFWIPCMLMAIGIMYLYLRGVCRVTALAAGYCCAYAFLVAEFSASLEWQIHAYLLYRGMSAWWWQGILILSVYLAVLTGVYFLEASMLTEEYMAQISFREFWAAVGIATVAFSLSNLSFVMNNTPFTGSLTSDIFIIRTVVDLCGMAVLYAFRSRICEYMVEKEKALMNVMLKSQYEQYRNYQDSIELIHIKYHDLKHQIIGLQAENDTERRKMWLSAMEKELEEEDLLMKTGNPVLDAVLGAKLLYAREKGIQVTCVVDGTLLRFMHVTDICSIFGNALDNALESVAMMENPQKRLIHVVVSAQRSFVFIQISNYCEQKMKRESAGQIPATTKADKKNHGFGLKSIRYSTEKYGGSMSVNLENNWFELRLLIPQEGY